MKTRDFEALEYVASSGYWRVTEEGDIETSRDVHGRPTDPPVWRSCTFPSPSKNSSTRKRIWVKGRRVYANRVVWRLTFGPIPEGYQVDHKDDNSLNDRPGNLQLLDGNGNLDKEANREGTRVRRYAPAQSPTETLAIERYCQMEDLLEVGDHIEATPEQRAMRPGFYSKTGEGEFPFTETGVILRVSPESYRLDKIDDAVEAQDWRISIAHDLKVGALRWWQAARRWFDVTFLGFRP